MRLATLYVGDGGVRADHDKVASGFLDYPCIVEHAEVRYPAVLWEGPVTLFLDADY